MKMQLNPTSKAQTIARILLSLILLTAGIGHLSWARIEFLAQVPDWVPLNKDLVVILSGIVEISMGLSLLFWSSQRIRIGWIVALFFVLVFPGNISQLITHTNAFGLNSDLLRGIRLLFQPVLVIWALWSTGAWAAWRKQ
ncbi:DoxX family protein [Pedobacter cryoconitis]|uniref:Putative membrane protein n=1 Tax=Pedobacter cryoconitis TaxID=188932 RepID=A0A327SUC6_9SPHI|nr:hypothetical protein [Pedobacter cryoconitis]RAJ29217.1 putative membrane protein [Pedobacter cryoconitis]